MIRIYAPATSANINVGFDNLGVAIKPINGQLFGDVVEVELSDELKFNNLGKFASLLPPELENNLIYKAYALFAEKLNLKNITPFKLQVNLIKGMPVGSGLGSSSASTVAALVAYNKIHNNPFNDQELLAMMGTIEGSVSGSVHFDNVAPCFLGGMQLMLQNNKLATSLPVFENWFWILCYSGLKVSTEQARELLPQQYYKNILINQVNHLAAFVHACHTKDQSLALTSMVDLVATPYRKHLLENYDTAVNAAKELGALATGISGSGPTIFAIAEDLETAQQIADSYAENYIQNDQGFIHICKVDLQGARQLED